MCLTFFIILLLNTSTSFLVRLSLGFYCTGPCSQIAHGRIVYILVRRYARMCAKCHLNMSKVWVELHIALCETEPTTDIRYTVTSKSLTITANTPIITAILNNLFGDTVDREENSIIMQGVIWKNCQERHTYQTSWGFGDT